MLVTFQDNTYLFTKSRWFLWEKSWAGFRPIDAVSWDGRKYIIDDRAYCFDPSSEHYGYGTKAMADFCETLDYDLSTAVPVSAVSVGSKLTWFYDRVISLTPCAEKDVASWKRMLCGTRPRTRRNIMRNRFTKRNLLK
jgi:hypothetical protein